MTEWNGIMVGGLYKRTGRGCRGAPLLMVTALEDCGVCGGEDIIVTALVDGREEQFELAFDKWEHDCVQLQEWKSRTGRKTITEYIAYRPWPYKEVV